MSFKDIGTATKQFLLRRWWAFLDYREQNPGVVRMYSIRFGVASFLLFLVWEGGCLRIFPDREGQLRLAKLREAEQLNRLEWQRPIKPLKSWAVGIAQPSVNEPDVSVTVQRVDLIPGKRARWFLSFKNDSMHESAVTLSLPNVYLADAEGNQYKVQSDMYGDNLREGFRMVVPAGVKRDYFLNFPAPGEGQTVFKVSLPEMSDRSGFARFANFEVTLLDEAVVPEPSKKAGPKAERVTVETGPYRVITVNFTEPTLDGNDFAMRLKSVELFRGDRMRWNFSFHNKAGRDRELGFSLAEMHLADEHGNLYRAKSDSRGTPANGGWRDYIHDGIRVDYYVEFPAPKEGATQFKFDFHGGSPPYAPFKVTFSQAKPVKE